MKRFNVTGKDHLSRTTFVNSAGKPLLPDPLSPALSLREGE
jgi:hypothetical protein